MRMTEEQFAEYSSRPIICQACGKPAPRRGQSQRYCEPCSETRDLERKRVWARGHPLSSERNAEIASAVRKRTRSRGQVLSTDAASGIAWSSDPQLAWMVRIRHPFDYGLSKNAIYRMGMKGHVTLRKEANALRQSLSLHVKRAMYGQTVVPAKLWIDLMVQKPNHRGDAVNVIDTVCDSIKDVIGIDDRWFCIRRLDWEVVKVNPMIFVGIGQEVTEPHKVCASCGRVLPLTAYHGKKRPGRECKECLTGKPFTPDPARDLLKVMGAPA